MGMLQLAGAVSGFGKGMGQGLQTMQNTMSQAMLMEERNKFDLARLRETFGHERGLLQERMAGDIARDDKRYERDIELEENRQDFQARQDRIQREEARQKESRDEGRTKAAEERQLQARIQELVVKEGLSRDAAAQKARDEMASEERADKRHLRDKRMDAAEKAKERQENTGKDIVIETLRGQRPSHTGDSKLDGTTSARLRIFSDRIKGLEDELGNVMTTDKRRAEIRREIARLQSQQNELVGIQSQATSRPPIRFPQ